jgi:hypothetical protein
MKDRPRKQSPKTPSADATSDSATELTQTERRIAKELTAPRAALIHEAIRAEGNLQYRKSALRLERENLIDPREFVSAQLEVPSSCIFGDVLGIGRFWDCE